MSANSLKAMEAESKAGTKEEKGCDTRQNSTKRRKVHSSTRQKKRKIKGDDVLSSAATPLKLSNVVYRYRI